MSHSNEKKEEPILFHADNSLIKIITNWKEFPHDQWMRELVLGRIQATIFKIPERDICGGFFKKVLLGEWGWILTCEQCGVQMPIASHQVFWTNHEHIIHMV